MDVQIKFLGANQTVTGSKHLLKVDDYKLLVDCGLFQGLKENRLLNWDDFPIAPDSIGAIVLTHAHIDHSGYLPRLYKQGFRGKIYCTAPTADLLEIMLRDSAKLQEEEALIARKKGYSKHDPPLPLYTTKDVEQMLPLIHGFAYREEVSINSQIKVVFQDAGHILGSAIAEVYLNGENQTKKIVFSGDIGRYNTPILYDPTTIATADILLVESTYGNRKNPADHAEPDLARIIRQALRRDGVLLIPAFALGRTQTLLYFLRKLMDAKEIPSVPVYVDSPMAVDVTYLYEKHRDCIEFDDYLRMEMHTLFKFAHVHFVTEQSESYRLHEIKRDAIIISASGMATGGRVLDHLYHRLPNPNDTVLIAGFQAEGTRGRKILEGEKEIKIYGEMIPVKCQVEHINGLSAHADQVELMHWLGGFTKHPKKTFIVHGEKESAQTLANLIEEKLNWNVFVPQYLETFELFEGI
ncbi:MAG: MBL fold metallo-hydrolase [Microscillaceae bacterium]|jgi:metallo-beta-lactamase family protein|nr:MBL fold metallo-hydrolase [Microscillaceae bacterium]